MLLRIPILRIRMGPISASRVLSMDVIVDCETDCGTAVVAAGVDIKKRSSRASGSKEKWHDTGGMSSSLLTELKGVFPQLSDAALMRRLEMYDYNVERTLESLCDDPPSNVGADVHEHEDVITFGSLILDGKVNQNTPRVSLEMIEIQPNLQLHKDVNNGDCIFYCLYLMLSRLVTFSTSFMSSPKELAAMVRAPVIQYIEDHWTEHSLVADMPWWQIIKFTHHEGIPEWEREEYNGDWGSTAEDSLIGWKKVRDSFYGSEAEMTAFVEMMWNYGIPLVIRVWRKNNDSEELNCSSTMRHPFINTNDCYVGDILHSGQLDSGQAHCQLMRSASFQTVIFVSEEEEEDEKPLKRKRKKKDDDPDYKPPKNTKSKSDEGDDEPYYSSRKYNHRMQKEREKKAMKNRRRHEAPYR